MQDIIGQKFPKSRWFTYDAIDSGVHQRAATQAFAGQSANPKALLNPVFHFDKAKVILSLDCDFLGGEDGAHEHIRKFAAGRKAGDGMSRLYAVESLFTLTGANADHRLRIPASRVGEIAAWVQGEIQSLLSGGNVSLPPKDDLGKWISECAKDLIAAGKNALVVAGQRQPIEVHLLAYAINVALGAIALDLTGNAVTGGYTVTFHIVHERAGDSIENLNEALKSKQIQNLVVLGGNPAYQLNFSPTQKPDSVVRLGYYEDETSAFSDWNFPAAHYLESWGDATTSDGTPVVIQPLIQPLFDGLTELEFLARIAGESTANPFDIIRETFRIQTMEGASHGSDEYWKKFLFNGFQTGFNAAFPFTKFTGTILPVQSVVPSASSLEVIFYRDSKVDDGRYANNGWMQELPDPITKMTWDNAVLISRKTAKELGLANGDIVEISLNGKSVQGPIWVQPGMADYSLGLALGYGREKAGRVGTGVGFNAYKIFSGKYIETGATMRKTGETHVIACTQHHWSMEGRPAVREANLEEFLKQPEVRGGDFTAWSRRSCNRFIQIRSTRRRNTALHQWGMTIDLNACVGCGTCIVACQSENNIPIVGKDQVLRGREMHWMRVDRYFTTDPKRKNDPSRFDFGADMNQTDENQQFEEWIDDVQAVNQPMMCQQCEAAPCENVCPVAATVHDQEGLNVMAYNRCIGTRYCSNNCPYKVRRFNFLDYNKPSADRVERHAVFDDAHARDGRPRQEGMGFVPLVEAIRTAGCARKTNGI